MVILQYSKWENFEKVIEKAKMACKNSGVLMIDHFPDVRKMVQIGSNTERELTDYELSRYACYLIAQNGDSRKKVIALAQSYFAIQTHKQEISEKEYNLLTEDEKSEETYQVIRNTIITAQSKVYKAVNSAMVQAYWQIGKEIYTACGETDRAQYGKKLLEYISKQLTKEFGKGFTVTNLKYMRLFYRTFPIRHTLCDELSWSHYRLLMRINDENARRFANTT